MNSAIIAICIVGFGILFAIYRGRGARPPHPPEAGRKEGAAVMAGMRQRVLSGTASEFGIKPIGRVWGVLMEMGFPEGWASLVALADGSASLYLSSGGGVIGGGSHEEVKKAALEACTLAGAFEDLPRVTEYPTPPDGRTRFYLLTVDGVRTAEEAEDVLGAGNNPLSPLFFAGQSVITQLRLISQSRGGG
jgi:hypothetical protein